MKTNNGHTGTPGPHGSTGSPPLKLSLTADGTLTAEGALTALGTMTGVRLVPWRDNEDADVAVVFAHHAGVDALHLVDDAVSAHHRPVLLVVGTIDEAGLTRAVSLGVAGVLLRHELDHVQLLLAARRAVRGEPPMSPSVVSTLLNSLREPRVPRPRAEPLTPREVVVLGLLAEGLTTAQVAKKLSYSERTIKNVLSHVITRLGLRNRTQAVAYAIRRGAV